MPSPKPNKSGEDSSDNRAQGQTSSPFISSPTSARDHTPGDDTNAIRQSSTPATVFEPPSHSPSPAIPHFTGALTANLNTVVNANTAVGRLIARGEATLQARNQNREDPFGAAGPSNNRTPEHPWTLDPFSSSSSGGGASLADSLPVLPRPSPAPVRSGSLLRSTRSRVRIEDSPRLALSLSSQADADTVVPAPAPLSPIVIVNPDFPPPASRGHAPSRGGHRNITVPVGPRPMPMGCNNSSPAGAHRNLTVPSVSHDARAQMPPPPPPHREIPIRRQPNQATTGGIWQQDTPPIHPRGAASGNTGSTFHPSAAVPPLFAACHVIQPIAPLRLPSHPTAIPPWQPQAPRPPRHAPSQAHPNPSPGDLELQLEALEQQQRQQLLSVQQRAWDLEQFQHQEHLHSQLQRYHRQQQDAAAAAAAAAAPATQYFTPGPGQFGYERHGGSIVRPAPMADPFPTDDGGAGNGWINLESWDLHFPPPQGEMEARLAMHQRRRRAERDRASPTPGAYDEPGRMLGEGSVRERPAAAEGSVQVKKEEEDEEGEVKMEDIPPVQVKQEEEEEEKVKLEDMDSVQVKQEEDEEDKVKMEDIALGRLKQEEDEEGKVNMEDIPPVQANEEGEEERVMVEHIEDSGKKE